MTHSIICRELHLNDGRENDLWLFLSKEISSRRIYSNVKSGKAVDLRSMTSGMNRVWIEWAHVKALPNMHCWNEEMKMKICRVLQNIQHNGLSYQTLDLSRQFLRWYIEIWNTKSYFLSDRAVDAPFPSAPIWLLARIWQKNQCTRVLWTTLQSANSWT